MSIRQKISVLLGLLALVMAFQSIDRVLYLNRLAVVFESLSDRVDQRLQDIQTLSQATIQLEQLSRAILDTHELSGMTKHPQNLFSILGQTRRAISKLDVAPQQSDLLVEHLDVVSDAIQGLIDTRRSSLEIARVRHDLRIRLSERSQSLQAIVLPMKIRILSEVTPGVDPSQAEESLRLLINLTSLRGRIEDLLTTEIDTATIGIEADVARLVSSSVLTLSISPRFKDDPEIGRLLAQIHSDMTGKSGLGVMDQSLRDEIEREGRYLSALDIALSDVGQALALLVSASEHEISEVYAEAALDAEQKILSEIVVNAGFGLGIVMTVWLVFARQISARLERLSRDVLRLASGHLEPIDKDLGSDELSRMAGALEVFRQNARELRRSNEELANFAYVASHDLRTPLRAIRDLVDWTFEDQRHALQPGVASNLTLIRTRADRLSNLLQDLLDYARAGQAVVTPSTIDLESIVRDIGELVDRENSLKLEYRGLRHVQADATPLRTILMNLIANAAKHSDQENVYVSVTTRSIPSGWEMSVQDDGPGIPLRYQEKVFELFKTLQSRDNVEGSGLGLAMVQKLVTHLEGEIELRSNPEQQRGTSFILRIPLPGMRLPSKESTEGKAA